MSVAVVVAWGATVVFAALLRPCLTRLTTLDYATLGAATRQADVAGLLMTVAMLAMVSPLGFPVPVAGWQAVFVVTAAFFLAAAVRGGDARCRRCDLHHGLGALAMLYMLAAMPHGDAGHGVWPTMVDGAATGGYALPLVAAGCVVYFALDGALTVRRLVRARRAATVAPAGAASRSTCRAVMSAGMAAMFAVGLAA
ncbi:DUF5134 domain-containing protein [Saccharomonospora sp. NB11]|uniref:DUF5134 domain-containing protein n=1 Tax=Saccharomonospora sp. NB11 TaxID=1642298 RepID=UPI0018D0BCFD|nr:DUF5134 domain-containing protein [Saccharomonospora sp. NB11]